MDTTDLPITGCKVRGFRRFGYQVRVELSGSYQLVVEGPFTLAVAGRAVLIDPEDPAADLGPHLPDPIGRTVSGAASTAGTLRVGWDGGGLEVPALDGHEAWQLNGPDGYLVVCMPGGELAVWSGDGR